VDVDTIKLYTKAHGSKVSDEGGRRETLELMLSRTQTTNLIINFENEDWILQDDAATLASVGIGRSWHLESGSRDETDAVWGCRERVRGQLLQ
jgi:hypothetical protein